MTQRLHHRPLWVQTLAPSVAALARPPGLAGAALGDDASPQQQCVQWDPDAARWTGIAWVEKVVLRARTTLQWRAAAGRDMRAQIGQLASKLRG